MSVNNDPEQPWNITAALNQLGIVPEEKASDFVPFWHILERLKTTKRTGWKRHGIKE